MVHASFFFFSLPKCIVLSTKPTCLKFGQNKAGFFLFYLFEHALHWISKAKLMTIFIGLQSANSCCFVVANRTKSKA